MSFLSGHDYPPPTDLITIPTAGTLVRGSYSLGMRIDGGGMITGLQVGLTDRFNLAYHMVHQTLSEMIACVGTLALRLI